MSGVFLVPRLYDRAKPPKRHPWDPWDQKWDCKAEQQGSASSSAWAARNNWRTAARKGWRMADASNTQTISAHHSRPQLSKWCADDANQRTAEVVCNLASLTASSLVSF